MESPIQNNFTVPSVPPATWIDLVHTPEYRQAYITGTLDPKTQRRIGLPWSPHPSRADLYCCRRYHPNRSDGTPTWLLHVIPLAAPTTPFPSYGSGFCIFNDIAIAIRTVQHLNLAQKILIIDLDVHQGDGNAFIFQDDSRVFTFSMHCEKKFSLKKANQRSRCSSSHWHGR